MHCLMVSHSWTSDIPVFLAVFPWPHIPVSLTCLTICYVPVPVYKTPKSCMSHYVRISTLIHSVYLTLKHDLRSTHNFHLSLCNINPPLRFPLPEFHTLLYSDSTLPSLYVLLPSITSRKSIPRFLTWILTYT